MPSSTYKRRGGAPGRAGTGDRGWWLLVWLLLLARPGEAAPDFPLPWASDPAASHLLTAPSTQAALRDTGFSIDTWNDLTEQAINWNMAHIAAAQNRPPALQALALPLVMGPDFPAMVGNLRRGITEGKLRLLQAIVRKPV